MSFKKCPNCSHEWSDRTTFLSDPKVRLLGYQPNSIELGAGFFLFSHDTDNCGTSLAVEVEAFADMHKGPVFEDRLTGTPECPGYCFKETALSPCGNKCECAYVRDVIQRVNGWEKRKTA